MKKYRWTALLLAAACSASLLTGCGSKDTADDSSTDTSEHPSSRCSPRSAT